jgi:putative endopeptidase
MINKLLCAMGVLCLALVVFAQTPDQKSADKLPELNRFDPAIANEAKDPCTDFYAYACSKWQEANPIPEDQYSWGTTSNLNLWNQTLLRQTMDSLAKSDAKRSPVEQRVGDYWQSCMDESAIETLGVKAIQSDLDRIAAIKNAKQIAQIVAGMHGMFPGAYEMDNNYAAAPILGFYPLQDLADATLVVATIDQGGMGMPGRDYYLSDTPKLVETRAKYKEHLRKMFQLAGDSAERATANADTVMKMETALAKSAMDSVKRRDPKNLYNVMSLQQVRAATPSFDWDGYLKGVGAPTPKHYIVTSPEFFKTVEQMLKSESLDNWKTYLRWWTLHGNAPYLSKSFVDENFDFYGRALTGAPQMRPRWRRCVQYADRDLGEALGQAYVDRAFPAKSRERVQELVDAVESALERDVDQLDWMSPETKKEAKAKLAAIEDKIGYPKKWRDYSTVKIGRGNFAQNVHQATAHELKRQVEKIGNPVDRGEWTMTPPTINAYYDPQLNTINFPAGILQPPFFGAEEDDAANYGAIGLVIGHEIIHGFDDQGRKFDAKGNLRDWWTADDAKKYDERGKCISDQYTQELPEYGVKQNGLLTQGEDTADNGGIRLAMMALEDTYQKKGKSLDEKGADGWTPRQKFFMAHAFSWCRNVRPEIARTQVVTDPHSLPKYRVNNVESNSPDFWRAFGCKAGQPMRRENACRVW